MPRILKSGLIIALVFGAVWLAVIIVWQQTNAMPTGRQIGMYMLALPLAILLVGWLGIKAVRAAQAPSPAAETTATAAASGNAAPVADARAAQLHVLASAAIAAPGATPADIREALAQQKRPELDPLLKDAQGFPVFSGRVPGLDTGALRDAARMAGAIESALDDEPVRATVLLCEALDTMMRQAVEHKQMHGPRGSAEEAEGAAKDADWPMLHVDLLLPGGWAAEARERAEAEARAKIKMSAWPAARIQVASHAIEDLAAVPRHLHALAALDANGKTPALRIVAACDSYISDARVRQLQSQRQLMTNAQPQGRVPGEAAAALLLADPLEAGRRPDALLVTLSPFAQRQAEADARGAAAGETVPDLARVLLQELGMQADAVAALVSDADHRGTRPIETMGLATALLPHLDPTQDCPAVGNGCGHVGAAAALLTLALAADAARDNGAPVLALLTQDPVLRAAALAATPDQYPSKHPSDSSHHA